MEASHQHFGPWIASAYAEHAPTCLLYARQIAPECAEDVVQEAFMKLIRFAAAEGTPPREVRAWLLTATRSAAIDRVRSESRRRRRERSIAPKVACLASEGDLFDAHHVTEALAGLPERRREVVVLRLWGGLGFAEIAKLLGVGLSTAHDDYHNAINELRRKLGASVEALP